MVGLRIAHAAHNRQLSVLPLLGQTFEGRVQSELAVQDQHIAWGIGQFGPGVMISIVGIGDHGVDAVVAAVQREQSPARRLPSARGRCLASRIRSGQLTAQAPDSRPAAPRPALAIKNLRRFKSGIGTRYDVRYSGVLTAAATSWTGLRTNDFSAVTVRSDHARPRSDSRRRRSGRRRRRLRCWTGHRHAPVGLRRASVYRHWRSTSRPGRAATRRHPADRGSLPSPRSVAFTSFSRAGASTETSNVRITPTSHSTGVLTMAAAATDEFVVGEDCPGQRPRFRAGP